MVRQAAGGFALPDQASLTPRGAAVEARVYAENAAEGFRPSTGLLTEVRWADGVRIDTWVETGTEVTPYYDPLLAKLVAYGDTRAAAIDSLAAAVRGSAIWGLESNLGYLAAALDDPEFRAGAMTTATLGALPYAPRAIAVLSPGTASSIQELPGRLGAWAIGIPPSGPMDSRSHRRANALVGNPPDTAALELTLAGPTLRFDAACRVAICGAAMPATLDGAAAPHDAAFAVAAGQVLAVGRAAGPGLRATLAVSGGLDAPVFMGSRATFALGGFGGHATGLLRTGDVLRLGDVPATNPPVPPAAELTSDWTLGVLYGPHGAPDFFTGPDIETLFAASYEVHFNSARTGVRLIGPKPQWARPDGGEAGLHPSNIHDNAYAVGSIDFTGDMPILLGPDGPSLGGFVCPAVVASDELWKLGQLRPGDRVRFARLAAPTVIGATSGVGDDPVLLRIDADIPVKVRRAGDAYVLVEFGGIVLDLRLRLRAQLLLDALVAARLPGVIDLTPGIRSLQVHFDPAALGQARLLDTLAALIRALPTGDDVTVASRTIRLPLSWDDPQARLAMRRYQELTRPDAPWCPSNIEFIRRINGLASEDEVRRTVFDATYVVLGLGDVYLGAPVAVALDPRHQLVTTKYNPARPWTPENAVGIGGAYLCVYGMEGPGGYQLFGRTIQVWNAWRRTPAFADRPLLRCFDRISWYPVDAAELLEARAAFPHRRYAIEIEDGMFSLAAHQAFLAANAATIAAAGARQRAAFEAERQDWAARGLDQFEEAAGGAPPDTDLPPGCVSVDSPVPGVMWKLLVAVGDPVRAGDPLAVVESMKTEMQVASPVTGRVRELPLASGREVRGGQRIAVVELDH
jgi:urea carboxylase